MGVGLLVSYNYYTIGHSSFLNSFFDTVHYHLEEGDWGSKYPLFFNDFYNGIVHWEDAPKLIEIMEEIRGKLSAFKPDEVIWDIEDLSQKPPWGDYISEDITSLANYFCTSDGAFDLIDVIIQALRKGYEIKSDIEIK
jgi:hypothetical protein